MLAILKANLWATGLGILAAIFAVIAVVQSIQLNGFLWMDGATDKLEDCQRDNNELRAGVAEAKRLNDEQVARIEADQEKVNDDIAAKYRADLARLRGDFDKRLRLKAPPRNPGGSQASPVPNAPGGSDGEELSVPRSELLQCEQDGALLELGRNALIDWINEQLKVVR